MNWIKQYTSWYTEKKYDEQAHMKNYDALLRFRAWFFGTNCFLDYKKSLIENFWSPYIQGDFLEIWCWPWVKTQHLAQTLPTWNKLLLWDISQKMLDKAEENLINLPNEKEFIKMDLTELSKLKKSEFENIWAVYLLQVLQHVPPEKRRTAIQELFDILKLGWVITILNTFHPEETWTIRSRVKSSVRKACTEIYKRVRKRQDYYPIYEKEIIWLLEKVWFRIDKVHSKSYNMFIWHIIRNPWTNQIIAYKE